MLKVSAVVIIRNEAENLKMSLPKLLWCNEIIIVDDFSTDESISICESFGCKIFQRKLDGFGTQKNFAVSKAANNWVLSIDADELLTDELIEEIKHNLDNVKDNIAGFELKRQHAFMKRSFKYSKESQYYLRLFDRTKAAFNNNKVHETVQTKYPVIKLKNTFIHNSFRDIAHYIQKQNYYTTLYAEEKFCLNKRNSIFVKLLTSPFVFFKTYFINLNFLEGIPGLAWSLFYSWFRLIKNFKLEEKYR